MLKTITKWSLNNPLFILSIIIILVTTVFIGFKNGKTDMIYSDAIVDHNLLQTPLLANDVNIQAIHTHLIKWPIIMFENFVGLTAANHVIFSIILLAVMNAWLGYLFYIFSKRNFSITALCLIALASIEIMMGISAGAGTMTMITIRNIELPAVITLIYLLMKQQHFLSTMNLIYVALLALLFASDFLILYTAVLGLIIYLLLTQFRLKHGKWTFLRQIKDKSFYLSILSAAILTKLILALLSAIGLGNFYEMQGSNDSLSLIGSFREMFLYTLDYAGEIMAVFGAGFFGHKIFDSWMFIINVVVFIVSIYLIVKALKSYAQADQNDTQLKTIIAITAMYFVAMLLFTVLIPRELAGRYFAFAPIIGLLLIAYYGRNFNIETFLKKMSHYPVTIIFIYIFTLLLFCALIIASNKTLYQKKYSDYSKNVGDTSHIVNVLEKEQVSALISVDLYERSFWNNHVLKQQYDQKTGKKLAIVSVFCGGTVVDRQFSKRSWSQPNGSRVALRVTSCDPQTVEKLFGTPNAIHNIKKDDNIYIYNDDIRDVLDMRQYDLNRFLKK